VHWNARERGFYLIARAFTPFAPPGRRRVIHIWRGILRSLGRPL